MNIAEESNKKSNCLSSPVNFLFLHFHGQEVLST